MLSSVGLYATVVTLLQLFVAFGRRMRPPSANTFPMPGSWDFMDALSAVLDTPVRRGGRVRLLNDGADFFPALLEAIRGAEHHIHLMTYIWKKSRIGDEIFDAILERARAGVEVRLMIDGIGSLMAPDRHLRALKEAGGKVAVFSPLLSSHFVHVNNRNHRRAFIVDGRIAFTGGMSVADQWVGEAGQAGDWRDTMVRVTGPMAHTVQIAFLQLWTNITGEHLIGPGYLSTPSEEEIDGDVLHLGVAHVPTVVVQPLLHVFWLSIMGARERIYIANAYFAPSRSIRKALVEKARAGLDVRLLLPSRHTDNPFVRWAAHALYDRFLEAGIRIYEYTPSMMHAKHMLVDDRWTLIGSANIDLRSIRLNLENLLGICDRELACQVEAQFADDFACAEEVTADAWRQRPWWYRLRERGAGLFRAQY